MGTLLMNSVEGLYFVVEDITWFEHDDLLVKLHEMSHQFLMTSSYGVQCRLIGIGSFFAYLDMLRMVEHGTVSDNEFANLGRGVLNSYRLMSEISANWIVVQESFANIYSHQLLGGLRAGKNLIESSEIANFVRDGITEDVLGNPIVPHWYRDIVRDAWELYDKRSYEDFALCIVYSLNVPTFLQRGFLEHPAKLDFAGRYDINPDYRFKTLREELIHDSSSVDAVATRLGILNPEPSIDEMILCLDVFDGVLDAKELSTLRTLIRERLIKSRQSSERERKLQRNPDFLGEHLRATLKLDSKEGVDLKCCSYWLEEQGVTKSDVIEDKAEECAKSIFVANLLNAKPVPACWAQPLADSIGTKIQCEDPKPFCRALLGLVKGTIDEFHRISQNMKSED